MCVLVHMPLNLAVLNENAADAVIAAYPDITRWYLCGHSMGGSAAVNYSWKHPDQLNGLILLASRIKRDFSQSDLPVLLVSATEDEICTPERLKSGIRQVLRTLLLKADATDISAPMAISSMTEFRRLAGKSR